MKFYVLEILGSHGRGFGSLLYVDLFLYSNEQTWRCQFWKLNTVPD